MSWHVLVAKNANKSLGRFLDKDQRHIVAALRSLAEDPWSGDVTKIEGERNVWRRRVGNYRIIFEVDIHGHEIFVFAITRRTTTTY